MNSRASKEAKAAMEEASKAQESIPKRSVSLYENPYHQFSDDLIESARQAGTDLSPILRDLNRIAVLTDGMGAVMRIVSGNCVVADQYDPSDETSEPPLSRNVIGSLQNLAAEVCEIISSDICRSADWLSKKVEQ